MKSDFRTEITLLSPNFSTVTTEANSLQSTQIANFLLDIASHDSQNLYQILKYIRHENIKYLHESSGYRMDLLIYASLVNFFSEIPDNDINRLLSEFWQINEQRLVDTNFFHFLESLSDKLLNLEKSISIILKDRTSGCLLCVECRINVVSVLYLPCGHIVLCTSCHGNSAPTNCRICNFRIDEYHNVYF